MNTIAICGVGRLGLPLALNFERSGVGEVIGFDIDTALVDALNARAFPSDEPGVVELLERSRIAFTSNPADLHRARFLVICVRTDSVDSGAYDLSQLWDFIRILRESWPGMRQSSIEAVAIACNVNPGTTRTVAEMLRPCGVDVYFWPEWVRQGNIVADQTHPEVSVLGRSPESRTLASVLDVIRSLDRSPEPRPIRQLDPTDAEIAKIALNCFLTVKISFANMMGNLLDEIGIDAGPILEAISGDSRIGPRFFSAGFGYGGPCLPRDNAALIHFARRFGVDMPLCSAADEVNARRHQTLLKSAARRYHETGTVAEIDSLGYKQGVGIFTESQQLRFANDLASIGIPLKVRRWSDSGPGIHRVERGEYFIRAGDDAPADGGART